MVLNPQIFREYDIRGAADVDFAEEPLKQLASAFATYFWSANCSQVLVGRDCRISSPRIRDTVVQTITSMGLSVVDIGQVTTPMFYFAREHMGINAGIMITASHNPPHDNGMKVALGPATIYGQEIQKILKVAQNITLDQVAATVEADLSPGRVKYTDVSYDYVRDLQGRLSHTGRPLKVVVDCGNGTSGPITGQFFTSLGIDYIPIYFDPDGRFPNHEPDPVKAKNLVELRRRVLEEQADVGIAFDGDGDRIGVVDDQGNVIWGDTLMALYWREILPKYPGALGLVEVKCSQSLVDEIRRLGGQPDFCKTGHSLIKAKMRETGAVFTGEMSGHMFFADEYYGYDDALYACGRLLRILAHSDQSLSQLLSVIPKYHSTAETRIPCTDDAKFEVVEELCNRLSQKYDVITVDGVRVLFPEGWGLFRCSNTQPVIVARCEARSSERLAEYANYLSELFASVYQGQQIYWEI